MFTTEDEIVMDFYLISNPWSIKQQLDISSSWKIAWSK